MNGQSGTSIFDIVRNMQGTPGADQAGGAVDPLKKTWLDAKSAYDKALNDYQGMHNTSMNATSASEHPDQNAYDMASKTLDMAKNNMDKAYKSYLASLGTNKETIPSKMATPEVQQP